MASMVEEGQGQERVRPEGRESPLAPALVALVLLVPPAAVWVWWAIELGAYFGVVFLPGAMILLALLGAMLLWAPWPFRLRGAPLVAVAAVGALTAWTLLSVLWTPTKEVAIADAQRWALYAAAFALGLWTCSLLGRRPLVALAPISVASAVVATVTVAMIAFGDDPRLLLEEDATLHYPLGYRNSNAAFFMIAVWPLLILAREPSLSWWLRGPALGFAVVCAELAVLCQSRAALFAGVAAVAVLIALGPRRLRTVGWLALLAAPVVLSLPILLDVYDTQPLRAALPPLRDAAAVIALTGLGAAVVAALIASQEHRLQLPRRVRRGLGGALIVGAGAVALIAAAVLVSRAGGPVDFVSDRVDELTAGSEGAGGGQSRYGVNLSSERGDVWRVAFEDGIAAPALGTGAGGFHFSYLLHRDSDVSTVDPHSVVLQMFGELGFPGLALFAAFLAAATLASLRSRRCGEEAAALTAAAVTVGAYWLVHASVEWVWIYPAATAPVLFTLGAACAPALTPSGSGSEEARVAPMRARLPAAAALGLVIVTMVPVFASERYTRDAAEEYQSDAEAAYRAVDRAARLNPFSPVPLMTEAMIAGALGDSARARSALDEATELQPDYWEPYFRRARALLTRDPAAARLELQRAEDLFPTGEGIAELREDLRRLEQRR